MSRARAEALALRIGASPAALRPLAGGDTSSVWRCGPHVVKVGAHLPADLFHAEARALAELRAHGVPTPEVRAVYDEGIVLAWEAPGPPDPTRLGEQIAKMHSHPAPAFGVDARAYLGEVPLQPGSTNDLHTWLVERRLKPLVRHTRSVLSGDLAHRVVAQAETTPLPDEGPRLVHGDLWAGNIHHAQRGPVLIDPSCTRGPRALDLAMMTLFGGFDARCWSAYEHHLPLTPDIQASLPLFRLIPLLAHVAMFGSGYVPHVRQAIERLRATHGST